LATLVVTATKADGVRDYFEVGAIHYSTFGARNALGDRFDRDIFRPISILAHHPLRVEERRRLRTQAMDRTEYEVVRMPIWIEPLASGWTKMCAGLEFAHQVTRHWAEAHPASHPPTVIHVTDGHPTDGDPLPIAAEIRNIRTRAGPALLFNLHIDARSGTPIVFPSSDRQLPNSYARRLFNMSSELPSAALDAARHEGIPVDVGARGFVYTALFVSVDHVVASPEAVTRREGHDQWRRKPLYREGGETIIFKALDFIDPSQSPVFQQLAMLPSVSGPASTFGQLCHSPINSIPSLADFIHRPMAIVVPTIRPQPSGIQTPEVPQAYVGPYPVIDASDFDAVMRRVGQRIELIGKIVSVKEGTAKKGRGGRNGQPYIFVNFGQWNTQSAKLTIWSEAIARMTKDQRPSQNWVGKWLSVTGLIDPPFSGAHFGKPYVSVGPTIDDPGQIQVIERPEALFRLGRGQRPRSLIVGTATGRIRSERDIPHSPPQALPRSVSTLPQSPHLQAPETQLSKNQKILDQIRQKSGQAKPLPAPPPAPASSPSGPVNPPSPARPSAEIDKIRQLFIQAQKSGFLVMLEYQAPGIVPLLCSVKPVEVTIDAVRASCTAHKGIHTLLLSQVSVYGTAPDPSTVSQAGGATTANDRILRGLPRIPGPGRDPLVPIPASPPIPTRSPIRPPAAPTTSSGTTRSGPSQPQPGGQTVRKPAASSPSKSKLSWLVTGVLALIIVVVLGVLLGALIFAITRPGGFGAGLW